MKKLSLVAITPALLGAFHLFTATVLAVDPTPMAGNWRIINFSTPDRLTMFKDSIGVVTGIAEASNFEASTGTITVLSNHTFSGNVPDPVSGTIASGRQGEIIIYPNGSDALTFHLNRAADFMANTGTPDPGFQDLIIGVRSPTNLAVSDLAGTWNVAAFFTPYQLDLVRNSSNQVINISGLGNFGSYGGTLTMNTNGTVSGVVEDAFSGTFTVGAGGTVTLTITNSEGTNFVTLYVNASKDTMLELESYYDQYDNYQQVLIAQKAPVTTPPPSDLASHWRIISFNTPQPVQQKDVQGRVIHINGADFEARRQYLVSGHDGFFTAQVGATATGTLTPGANGNVTVQVQDAEGSDTFGFILNASKNILASARSIGDGDEFLLVTKSTPEPGAFVDFGLVMSVGTNGLTFDWAAAANSVLEVSTNLANWLPVTNTVGAHSYTTSTTNLGTSVYRVSQPMP